MKVLGLTLGETATGKKLKDGSLCWLRSDKNVLVVSEEQAANKKHKGGYEDALRYFYANTRSVPEIVAISSCCEPERTDLSGWETQFGCEVRVINHHLSHAHLAAWNCGYQDCLIIVLDAGGNVLEPYDNRGVDWWKYEREQCTIFQCINGQISMVDRLFSEPFTIGPGEFWRYMTYACGFESSTQASKVMELAGLSTKPEHPLSDLYFELPAKERPINCPPEKELLLDFIGSVGSSKSEPKDNLWRVQAAAWAQASLEREVIKIANRYARETGQKRLCLSGGVALNCRMIEKVRSATQFEDLHVGFLPSDKGQSLGNCLAASGSRKRGVAVSSRTPFIGIRRSTSLGEIRRELGPLHLQHIVENGVVISAVLELLSQGFLIGTWRNRAEVGARALGNSSLLADAGQPAIKKRINELKARPLETPVAPVFSQKTFKKHFPSAVENYNWMGETVDGRHCQDKLPQAIFHMDGSIRPQVVSPDADGFLSELVREHERNSAEDFLLLNTSFNGSGRPMAGTLEEAVSEFKALNLDALICSKDIILRRKDARLEACLDKHDPKRMFFRDHSDFKEKSQALGLELSVEIRERFLLFDNYIRWVAEHRKVTTIRFKKNALSIAASGQLPLIETKNFKQSAMDVQPLKVEVLGFTVKRFSELDNVDAQRDGFEKTSHLKQTLRNIYPDMNDEDYVTINFIKLA